MTGDIVGEESGYHEEVIKFISKSGRKIIIYLENNTLGYVVEPSY